MKRKLLLAGVIASFLAFASALNGPVEAQVGIGRTTTIVSSDLTVGTADFTLQGDDFYVSWGADNDFRLEFVSASDQLDIRDDADVQIVEFMDFPTDVADYADTFLVNIGAGSTIANMDNSDDYSVLQIDIVNGNHTGSSNILNGIEIVAITGDAQAAENAINIGAGWDVALEIAAPATNIAIINSSHILQLGFGATHALRIRDSGSGRPFTVNNFPDATSDWGDTAMIQVGTGATVAVMDGSDDYAMLEIDVVNGNHTSTGNTLNLLEFTALTGDAEANLNAILIGALTGTTGSAGERETAINIADGWDNEFYFEGTTAIFNQVTGGSYIFNSAGTAFFTLAETSAPTAHLHLNPTVFFNNSTTTMLIAPTASAAMLGSDDVAIFQVSVPALASTGTGNTISAIEVSAITGDANQNTNGILIGALTGTTGASGEVEYAINVGSGWDAVLAANNAILTEAELEIIDGVTVGTAAASKVLTLDSTSQLGGMGILRHTVTALTNSEINNLAATPILVVAAPGSNLTTIVVGWRFFLDFVGTGFDDAAADGNIVIEYAPGTQIGASMEADALIDAGADFSSYTMVSETGPVSTATPSNNAIEIANDGDEFTDTGGDAIAEVEVWYFIVDSNPTQ